MILIQGQCEPLPVCQMLDLVYSKDRWPGAVHHRETKLNQQLTKHGTFCAWGDSATCCKMFWYKERIPKKSKCCSQWIWGATVDQIMKVILNNFEKPLYSIRTWISLQSLLMELFCRSSCSTTVRLVTVRLWKSLQAVMNFLRPHVREHSWWIHECKLNYSPYFIPNHAGEGWSRVLSAHISKSASVLRLTWHTVLT